MSECAEDAAGSATHHVPGEAPLSEIQNTADMRSNNQSEQKFDVSPDSGDVAQENSAITKGRELAETDPQRLLSEESLNEIAKQLYFIQNYAFEAEENIADVEHSTSHGPGFKRRKVEENKEDASNQQDSSPKEYDMDYYDPRVEKDRSGTNDRVVDKNTQTQLDPNIKIEQAQLFAVPLQNSSSANKTNNVRFRVRSKPGDSDRVQSSAQVQQMAIPEQRARNSSDVPIFDGSGWSNDARQSRGQDYYDFRGEKPMPDVGYPKIGPDRQSTSSQQNHYPQRRERSNTVPRPTNQTYAQVQQPQPVPAKPMVVAPPRMAPAADHQHQNWPPQDSRSSERMGRAAAPALSNPPPRQNQPQAQHLVQSITHHLQWLSKSFSKSIDDQNVEALHHIESSLREVMPGIYWKAFNQPSATQEVAQPRQAFQPQPVPKQALQRDYDPYAQSPQTRPFAEQQQQRSPQIPPARPREYHHHQPGHPQAFPTIQIHPEPQPQHLAPRPRKGQISYIVVDPTEEQQPLMHPGAPLRVDSRVSSPVQENHHYSQNYQKVPVATHAHHQLAPPGPRPHANGALPQGLDGMWGINNSDRYRNCHSAGQQLAPICIQDDEQPTGHAPFSFARYGLLDFNHGHAPHQNQKYSYPSSSQSGLL